MQTTDQLSEPQVAVQSEGSELKNLREIYGSRFSPDDAARKDRVWREVARYLQRFVGAGSTVLDVGCDKGHFIRNIDADEKWATDLRDVSGDLGVGIRFVQGDGLRLLDVLPDSYFDVVFMSNYLEHLRSADDVIEQLRVTRELLKPGGRVVVLQPNIRLVGGRYWDFIDHSVALTERSLVEAAELAGLVTREVIVRFLPYTTKSRIPRHPILVRAYLSFPPVWLLLGRQTLYVGERVARASAAS